MPGVTISASYGIGGSIVAPRVAELLGLQLLNRAISVRVAAELNVSVAEAESGAAHRSFIERLLSFMSPLAGDALGTTDFDPSGTSTLNDEAATFREEAERIMRAALDEGAVILGRAGGAAFRDTPGVLRVRLFGSLDAAIARAAEWTHVDLETARRRSQEVNQARAQYVRRLYKVSVDDPALYHVQLDTTALPLPICADLIAVAYRALQAELAG